MPTDNSALPAFRKPPVNETVLGVQFDPIAGFTSAHLGAFWKWLVAHEAAASENPWTKLTDAPPIEPVFEHFEESQSWLPDELKVRVSRGPPPFRLQIRNDAGDAMIQVQDTRLHYNWISQPGRDYPHYTKVRPAFDHVFDIFRAFLRAEQLGDPKENQWEVTYVNNVPKGTVWKTPSDWARLFVGLPGPWAESPGVQLESVGGAWHFEIAPKRGRLHVDLKHGRLGGEDPKEMLRMTLTARGSVGDPATGGISLADGLDLGRKTIVSTFAALTSTEAHGIWERTQ